MKTFIKWLETLNEGGRRTAGKAELYPLGYSNIGLYPVGDALTHSADAIYYLDKEDRKYKGQDGPPFTILHLKHDIQNHSGKMPVDTSTQFKYSLPADTSTQIKRFIP